MKHILKFSNPWNEWFYFVATGATHYSESLGKTIHLIVDTTTDVKKARIFDSVEDADLVLARAGNPSGWEVVPV